MSQIVTYSPKIKLSEAAEIIGVCEKTLLNWHQKGLIRLHKTPTGHWRIERKEIERVVFEVKK